MRQTSIDRVKDALMQKREFSALEVVGVGSRDF